jgi:DNA-binding CsgD family transcriptional regulator
MFDLSPHATPGRTDEPSGLPRAEAGAYCGPERRAHLPGARHWLAATLDELDYGVLLLRADARVLHANHAARCELVDRHPLQLLGGQLRVRRAPDVVPLHDALCGAALRGLRKLLTLGEGVHRVSVSVVPLASPGAGVEPVVLLILGKQEVCEGLSVQGFARSHRLSAGEARVLALLCQGVQPIEIAAQFGVAISTVRSQIGNIRVKTGTASIRALVRLVAVLPPLRGVLRGEPGNVGPWKHSGPSGS